ncbi:hypothetical protein NQ317_011207 [Molorchus minor]|uniref:Uncharacterized protein n=1 Tax=Molorchus minor TaxID=1323400 RepID=A0ABQ9JSQ5_9CUCU|nr:hypothetical protein NQ317_011207 [Molorchus minor]
MTTTKIPLRHRKPTTTEEHPQIYAPTTQLPQLTLPATRKPFKVYPAHEPYYTNEIKPTRTTTKQPKVVTILSVRQKSRTPARTSKPQREKSTSNGFKTSKTRSSSAGEEPLENSVSTRQPPIKQDPYVNLSEEYYVATKPTRPETSVYLRPVHDHITRINPNFATFNNLPKKTLLISTPTRLQNQINQYYTTPRTTYRPVQSPKPLYQFNFQAANCQPQQITDLNLHRQIQIKKTSSDLYQNIKSYQPNQQQIDQPLFIININRTIQETPQKTGNYYTTAAPNYIYEELTQKARLQPNVVTTGPIAKYSLITTKSCITRFYTKPDEDILMIIPKNVSGNVYVEHTTPTPNIQYYNNNQQVTQYQRPLQKPVSLETDTIVNYVHPRPPLKSRCRNTLQDLTQFAQPQKPHLSKVRIKAVPIEVPVIGRNGSFMSYQLPWRPGGPFLKIFLTPQRIQRTDQDSGYFFSQSNNGRSRRN